MRQPQKKRTTKRSGKGPLLTRREILVAAGTAVFVTPIESELIGIYGSSRNWIVDQWKTFADPDRYVFNKMDTLEAEKLRLVRDLFVDRGKVLKLAGGRAHHRYPGRIHPDDEWACRTLAKVAAQLSRHHVYDAGGSDFTSTESFMCTGSPVSNERTRVFMEYRYVNPDDPDAGLIRKDNPRLKLPFEFLLERERLIKLGTSRHESEAGYSNPNWSLGGRGHLMPQTGNEPSDFLTIARIPNWLERPRPRFRDFKNSITIFGGCHGEGTAAIQLLFNNLELLKRLDRVAKEHEYWQAIVKVTEIVRRPHPVSGTTRLVAISLQNDLVAAERVTVLRG